MEGYGVVVLGRPGGWTGTFEYIVKAEQIAAYPEATNETDERFLSGELASPMFATVPLRATIRATFAEAMPESLPSSIPRLAGEVQRRAVFTADTRA